MATKQNYLAQQSTTNKTLAPPLTPLDKIKRISMPRNFPRNKEELN